MIITINDLMIFGLLLIYALWFIFNSLREIKQSHKQTCFVYCPKCRNELVSSNSFVEDKDGIVKYKCDKCGNISFFDFIHYPVPYLRTCGDDCKHCYQDKFGYCQCEYEDAKECDPDTMVKFEPRMCGKED